MRYKNIIVAMLLLFLVTSNAFSTEVDENNINYPTKNITILCPTPAGGGLDITTRTIAPEIEKILNAKIIVINRSGGAAIGVAEVAETAKPDGYTFIIIDKGLISNYETGVFKYGWRDFETVASLNKGKIYIVVNANDPYEDIEDLVQAAKDEPNVLTIGTTGSSGISFLNAFGFTSKSNAPIKIVPFAGGGDTKAAISGGHITAAALDGLEIMPLVEAGILRVLAVSANDRSPELPDVPTLKEKGIDFSLEQAKAIFAPKGTPNEVINIFSDAVKKAVESESFKKLCSDTMQIIDYMGPEELADNYEENEKIIRKLIVDAGLAKQ